MAQSLLADRFKLAVHFEPREASVLALVRDKPRKTGAKLYPHSNGFPCGVPTAVLPAVCDAILAVDKPNNAIRDGRSKFDYGSNSSGHYASRAWFWVVQLTRLCCRSRETPLSIFLGLHGAARRRSSTERKIIMPLTSVTQHPAKLTLTAVGDFPVPQQRLGTPLPTRARTKLWIHRRT